MTPPNYLIIREVFFKGGGINMSDKTFISQEKEFTTEQENKINTDNIKLQLKEEQFDIEKSWIQLGDVKVYRETFTENKSVTVPVKREELVIEKKVLSDSSESKNVATEVIRIPLSEEKLEIEKHKVNLSEVSIYKDQLQDILHIEETLKREDLRIKTTGSVKVIYESNSDHM